MASRNGTISTMSYNAPCRADAFLSSLLMQAQEFTAERAGELRIVGWVKRSATHHPLLLDLVVSNSLTPNKVGQKRLDVLSGSLFQAFSRQKAGELSHPFHVENRAVRQYPVLLRAPPTGIPKLVASSEIAAIHGPCVKILVFQAVELKFGNHARPQENITIFSGRPLLCQKMRIQMAEKFTEKQGQYLAFIHNYTIMSGRPPAEADLERFFRTTPPSIHQMILKLEEKGLISRVPGQARSIRLLVTPEEIPRLKRPNGP